MPIVKATALNDVIVALVAAISAAVTYPVYDGPPSKPPGRTNTKYLAIGAEELGYSEQQQQQPVTSATMDQTWYGLGQVAREEQLHIHCVAGAKATTVAAARALAMAVLQDVGVNLPKNPTPETYGALISTVDAALSHNVSGGSIVTIQFTISATARLV